MSEELGKRMLAFSQLLLNAAEEAEKLGNALLGVEVGEIVKVKRNYGVSKTLFLSDNERKELEEALKKSPEEISERVYLRIRACLLSASGMSVPDVAEKLGVKCSIVEKYINLYSSEGLRGLKILRRSPVERPLNTQAYLKAL